MDIKKIAMGTAAYSFVTFPIAVLWHVVLFNDLYKTFGYFVDEPNFLIGLVTIVIQGAVLSALYPLVVLSGSDIVRGLKFAAIVGSFFWTSHVLSFVAKQAVGQAPLFIVMETTYLALQFGIFGVLIGQIYRQSAVHKPGPKSHRS